MRPTAEFLCEAVVHNLTCRQNYHVMSKHVVMAKLQPLLSDFLVGWLLVTFLRFAVGIDKVCYFTDEYDEAEPESQDAGCLGAH